MKKITSVFLTIMVACMVLGGCTKDKVSLHARFQRYTPQSDSKVYMDDLTPRWNDGDLIKVNAASVTVVSDGTIEEVDPDEDGYGLFYPAAWASTLTRDGGTVTIPAVQTYAENADGSQNVLSPMAARAYEGDATVTMYNVCGLLRLNVTNGTGVDMQVTKIVLTAEESASVYLSGTYQLVLTTTGATLTYQSGGSQTLTLDCSAVMPAVANGSSKYFYVCVPAFNDDALRMRVKVYTNVGGYEYLFNRKQNSSGAHALAANQIGPVNVSVSGTQMTGAMSGVFSVSATKKVQFACGNLIYNGTKWYFGDSQTTIVTKEANEANIVAGTGEIDLFGWGLPTAPYTHTSDASDYCTVEGSIQGNASYDWGKQTIYSSSSATASSTRTWSTLTAPEWEYVVRSRGAGMAAHGRVYVGSYGDYYNGLILLPDNYDGDLLVTTNSQWADNSFSAAQWAAMEAKGAIFLPSGAGRREGTSIPSFSSYKTNSVYYWSATGLSGGNARTLVVTNNSAINPVSSQNKWKGFHVRPVTVVQ